MSKNTQPSRYHRGQSMVEFAVTVVILLILLAGVVDLGRAFFTYMTLRDAAEEGAMFGSIEPSNTAGIIDRVRANSSQPVDLTSADVVVQVTLLGAACTGNGIQVTVTYQNFEIAMPFMGSIIGSQYIPITAQVVNTILTPPCQ